jgi:endonuclease III
MMLALNAMEPNMTIEKIWRLHHTGPDGTIYNTNPPQRIKAPEMGHESQFSKPGQDFTVMMLDCVYIMEILLMACEHYCIAPIRCRWEFVLWASIGCPSDWHLRNFAMLVCLILSAATSDKTCIQCTAKLYEKGFLSVKAMAEAPLEDLKACIQEAGIHHKRAQFLKGTATKIMEEHNGILPSDYYKLLDLIGVGRKSIVLMLNEAFGFYFGIGTDSHVMRVALALGMVDRGNRISVNVDYVEASLRQWIPQYKFKEINKIFGGFAQLITQDIDNPLNDPTHRIKLYTFVRAIGDRLHKPYEIQVAFFVIAQLRAHYAKVAPKSPKAPSNKQANNITASQSHSE